MEQSRFTYIKVGGKKFIDHLTVTRRSDNDIIKSAEFTPLITGSNIDTLNEIFDEFENVTRLRSLQLDLLVDVTSSNLVINSTNVIQFGGQDQSVFKIS